MNLVQSEVGNVSSLRFNQDHGCFSCAMDSGFRIYNVDPLRERTHIDASKVGSVAICEMLYRTNLLAIVGGGPKQKYAENAVLLWDDKSGQFVYEITVATPIITVKLRRDRLYIVERKEIHVYTPLVNPTKLFTFRTGENPKGLCEVSPYPSSERQLLIFPGHSTGHIEIVDLAKIQPGSSPASVPVNAHKTELAYIAINNQGTLVATASVKGTLIRVFDTYKKLKLIELRRGSDPASFYCINFSMDSEFLVASSDKGTIHIFALKDSHLNRRLAFSNAAKWVGTYADSQWALATFTVTQECKCICAFGSNSSVYAICVDGTFHKYVYTNDGNCYREAYDVFLNICDDDNFGW